MNATLKDGLSEFQETYDAAVKDGIWQRQSEVFRRFWCEQVLSPDTDEISDDSCDVVIRILDRNGKGNTKGSEAVARAMVPQDAWRRLFNAIHRDRTLALLLNSILEEKDVDCTAALVDELHKINEGNKNWLTGDSANVLNALLAAFDPVNNLSIVSLNDRKALMDFLELDLRVNWRQASYGQRVAQSNVLLREATRALGLVGTARTISAFWYFAPVKDLWKPDVKVRREGEGEVRVTVPVDEVELDGESNEGEVRESHQVQATVAEIGAQMGFQIWLPRADRTRVLSKWTPKQGELLDQLPVGFDDATMKTIEQIDVLWVKRKSIVRAFEVEHTTSIYSGLLRMADLLAMQPNLKIRLHIVAPMSRRGKVLGEIRRPVFALLGAGPLSGTCTFLSYDSIAELRGEQNLKYLSDKVLEKYEEKAEEAD